MLPLTSNPNVNKLSTSSDDIIALFSSSNPDVESLHSSSSVERSIIPHLGTTYSWDSFEDTEEVEYAERYYPGGYHPTLIGDKFEDGKYVIIHKLGHGTSSTVWLAQNTLVDGEYVALKILTAVATETTNEHNILAHLHSKSNSKHPGHAYVAATSLGWFWFSGPNGYHLCLVGEVVGCNLQTCKDDGVPKWNFPIETSRAIAAQVILGLAYMHSLGVCHGDLNLNNILLHRPIQGLPVKEIYERYGVPYKVALHRTDNTPIGPKAPSYLVHPMVTSVPSYEVTNCRVKISDFSSAFMVSHESKDVGITLLVTPPEALFDETLTFSTDIWSLGCTLYSIGCTLYSIVGKGTLFFTASESRDGLIEDMVLVLGPLPGPWWERWEGREKYYTKDGKQITSDNFEPANLDYRFSRLRGSDPSETSEMTKAEAASLKALLSAMLVYNPSERLSAGEALTSDYMKNWAEPALVEALEKGEPEL